MHHATVLLSGDPYKFSFNTYGTDGAPETLAGTPSLDLRVNGSATQATAGLTLSADFDSRTGENQVTLDQDDVTLGLADGDHVEIFIAAGTVDAISVVGTKIADIQISDGSLPAGTLSDINAEVVDALATDTYAEPGQGTPGATITLAQKLNYLYKWVRNKRDDNGTTENLYADDGSTVDQKRTVSESGGTVTKGEIATGP